MEIISFRFDEELKKELEFIKSTLHSNQTRAIQESIHSFYHFLKAKEMAKKTPADIFRESGFIGSFKGAKDLSESYKAEIAKLVKSKHGIK